MSTSVDRARYLSAVGDARHSSRIWMLAAAALLASNLALALFVWRVDVREKTIIVPPHIDKPFSVHGDELSPGYLEQMARYFTQLLLTYQRSTAKGQFEAALHYFAPEVYAEIKAKLYADAERIARNDVSNVFYTSQLEIHSDTVKITGESVSLVGQHVVSREMKTYEIDLRYENGQLTITRFVDDADVTHATGGPR